MVYANQNRRDLSVMECAWVIAYIFTSVRLEFWAIFGLHSPRIRRCAASA